MSNSSKEWKTSAQSKKKKLKELSTVFCEVIL